MYRLLACAAIALSLLGNLAAQERNIQVRRYYMVKRGHMADFVSALKEMNAIYKKANVNAPTIVVQSITGPDHFISVRYYEKMSQALANRGDAFKGEHEAEYLAANLRLNALLDSRDTQISERDPEVSLPRGEIQPYIRVLRSNVKPDKIEEYRNQSKELFAAGVKPSGVKNYTVSRTRAGGPNSEFHSATGLSSLTEMDESPIVKAMGQAKYNAWLTRRNALVNRSEVNVYRYRADLSTYTAPK